MTLMMSRKEGKACQWPLHSDSQLSLDSHVVPMAKKKVGNFTL